MAATVRVGDITAHIAQPLVRVGQITATISPPTVAKTIRVGKIRAAVTYGSSYAAASVRALATGTWASGTRKAWKPGTGWVPGRPQVRSAGAWHPVTTPTSNAFVLGQTQPNAANTGLNVLGLTTANLTVVNGDLTISDAYLSGGGALDRLWVKGYVIFTAATTVTLSNSLIQGRPFAVGSSPQDALVHARNYANPSKLNLDNCKIICSQPDVSLTCIAGERIGRLSRCDISLGSDLVDYWAPAAPNVQGCYLHDFVFFKNDPKHASDSSHPGWSHNDSIQNSGSDAGLIFGNTIDNRASTAYGDWTTLRDGGFPNLAYNGCVILTPSNSQITNLTIKYNWFNGGYQQVHLAVQPGKSYNSGNSFEAFGNRHALNTHGGGPYSGQYVYQFYAYDNGMTAQTPDQVVHDNLYDNHPSVPPSLRGTPLGTPALAGSQYQLSYRSPTLLPDTFN